MPAYLDHAATTPMRAEAVEAMAPFFSRYGNPTGMHALGRAARQAIDESREVVANVLGADSSEVIFTSGGTEADNLALAGMSGKRVLCSAIEHHAVLRSVEAELIPVTTDGIIDLDALASMLDEHVALVSVMLVNNEVGTIQPLHKVHRLLERHAPHALLHTDAVQAMPWLNVAEYTRFADLVSISAHKFGGPQGVGALIARKGTHLTPLLRGGGQERERRSGTHNVAGIVGMAAALRATSLFRDEETAQVRPLRDQLVNELLALGAFETGDRSSKIAGNAHLCFPGIESEALLVLLDELGVYASAGASCSSGAMEPSHVLTAMGIDDHTALGSLRLSLGRTTTEDDIALALQAIPDAVKRLQEAV